MRDVEKEIEHRGVIQKLSRFYKYVEPPMEVFLMLKITESYPKLSFNCF